MEIRNSILERSRPSGSHILPDGYALQVKQDELLVAHHSDGPLRDAVYTTTVRITLS